MAKALHPDVAGVLVIAEEHRSVLAALAKRALPGTSVHEVRDASDALRIAAERQPKLVLAAATLLEPDIVGSIELLCRWMPGAAIVVVEDASRPMNDMAALGAGAQEVLRLWDHEGVADYSAVRQTLLRAIARQGHVHRLQSESDTDALTGLLNRRGWTRAAESAMHSCTRSGTPLLVLMWDVDNLKKINDTKGHGAGDRVLCWVADALRASLRASDVVGRWGGDEYVAMAPGAWRAHAGAIHARVTHELQSLCTEAAQCVTVSCGCADRQPGSGESLADLLHEADRDLYESKARRERNVSERAATITNDKE